MIVHWFGNVGTLVVDDPANRPIIEEQIAKAYKVPYWVIAHRTRPRWRDRPVWRFRAMWWRWFA